MPGKVRTINSSSVESALQREGYEVFQICGEEVLLAERVRENLLLDSGVRVNTTGPKVTFCARALQNDFPEDDDDALFARACSVADRAIARGYEEACRYVVELTDPTDPSRKLDSWYEVVFQKSVPDMDEVVREVRFAFSFEKIAGR